MSDASSGRLATPAEFPVTWEDEADANRPWRFERWHNPRPITPLSFDFIRRVYRGFARAHHAIGRPIRMDVRRFNCYLYLGVRAPQDDDPTATANDPQPDRPDNHATWKRRWLPEVQGYLASWEQFHTEPVPSSVRLLQHLGRSAGWLERSWEIHDRLALSAAPLLEFAGRELGWDEAQAQVLVGGTKNLSLESDDALRSIADGVREDPEISGLFSRTPAAELREALVAGYVGELPAELDAFLGRFGRKSDNFMELSLPSWREDCTPALALVKAQLAQPPRDHRAVRDRLVADREAAEAAARQLLSDRPPKLLEEFERELTFCRKAVALNEDHNYWIDQQVMYWARMDMLAAGRVLANEGIIANVDDVFFLTVNEVQAALEGDPAEHVADVRQRKSELAHWAGIEPPSELGAPAAAATNDALAPLFGEAAASGTDRLVRGMPASMGVVTARARVIRSIADAEKLGAGEVLVVETTSPPWTPLFGIAGALVTDGGGRLSHAAVVAREYGIAAVVGTVSGTRRIRDGQLVRVDGAAGTVELLEK